MLCSQPPLSLAAVPTAPQLCLETNEGVVETGSHDNRFPATPHFLSPTCALALHHPTPCHNAHPDRAAAIHAIVKLLLSLWPSVSPLPPCTLFCDGVSPGTAPSSQQVRDRRGVATIISAIPPSPLIHFVQSANQWHFSTCAKPSLALLYKAYGDTNAHKILVSFNFHRPYH